MGALPVERIRGEVDDCINVWSVILGERLGDRLAYAYAKGSGVKPWKTPIDYVPTLSDVDIHIRMKEGVELFASDDKFAEALGFSADYERLFLRECPDPLHVPRTQIVILNQAEQNPDWVPPSSVDEVRILLGSPTFEKTPSKEMIREIDLSNLEKQAEVLRGLPQSVMDRTGLDYWNLLRRLSWQVSPAPFRLLSQIRDPYLVWGWNRSRVVEELRAVEQRRLADSYESYYYAGWDAFETGFRDSDSMRRLLTHAKNVLEESTRLALELRSHSASKPN